MKTQTELGKKAVAHVTTHKIGNVVKDGHHIGNNAYLLDETKNGIPLQYKFKRCGHAKDMSTVLRFIVDPAKYYNDWRLRKNSPIPFCRKSGNFLRHPQKSWCFQKSHQ